MPLSRKSSGKQDETTPAGGGSLATTAVEQVRAIVEAAEATAAQIRADAERESTRMLDEARNELDGARERAASQASEQAGRVAETAASMLERIEGIERDLASLLDSLQSAATRLAAELKSVREQLAELEAAGAAPDVAPEPVAVPKAEAEAALATEEEEKAATAVIVEEDSDEEAEAPVAGDEDLEGARLIALNMALNGNSREDIDKYLQENFELSNRKALLDEVYASVES